MSNRLALQANEMDQRYRMAPGMRRQINKVFPSHWSFMLGEVALYSFIILLVSGVYLTLFFDPSMAHVIYDGAYTPLNGVTMTRAYETTLNLSFEVRGGLFVRRIVSSIFVARVRTVGNRPTEFGRPDALAAVAVCHHHVAITFHRTAETPRMVAVVKGAAIASAAIGHRAPIAVGRAVEAARVRANGVGVTAQPGAVHGR